MHGLPAKINNVRPQLQNRQLAGVKMNHTCGCITLLDGQQAKTKLCHAHLDLYASKAPEGSFEELEVAIE